MAFGSELVMMAGLGFVVLGPKRMHALLGQVARLRSEVEKGSRGWKSQIAAELEQPQSQITENRQPAGLSACSDCTQGRVPQ
jgi:Sec-independent protein translocase protein TatA